MTAGLSSTLERVFRCLDPDAKADIEVHLFREGHLASCPRRGEVPCWWCDSALLTPRVLELISQIEDLVSLATWSESSFPWLVVTWAVLEARIDSSGDGMRSESLELFDQLAGVFDHLSKRLSDRVNVESSSKGKLTEVCLKAAGLRVAAALLEREGEWSPFIGPCLSIELASLRSLVDVERAHALASLEIQLITSASLPTLTTAPAIASLVMSSKRSVTRFPRQSVCRIKTRIVDSDPSDVLSEPRARSGPANPLGQHAGRDLGELGQQRPDPWLDGGEGRRGWGALIVRRFGHLGQLRDCGPRDAEFLSDCLLWDAFCDLASDVCPVFQCDHPSIFGCSLFTGVYVQFSSGVDT